MSDDGKQHRKSQKKRASTCIEGDGDKRQRTSTQGVVLMIVVVVVFEKYLFFTVTSGVLCRRSELHR